MIGDEARRRGASHPARVDAERRVRSAVAVALFLGILSLLGGVRTWSERRYLDLETLLGLLDAALVLGLALALSRRWRPAPWLLLALAAAGAGYTLWSGAPALALLPALFGSVMYLRAIPALRELHRRD